MTGFFDLQVNGYGGVDFNQDNLTPEDLHRACERLEADGVAGILATIITEELDVMCRRIANLAKLRERDPLAKRLLAGWHVEGPFINPADGYRGAHPAAAVREADVESAQRLMEAGAGLVKLFTLAPEQDAGFAVTRFLAQQGVVVSAGHTNASLDELRGALEAGLKMFTHLGNGCPLQLPRHDNIVQRALSLADRLWLCFIADGVHVPTFALRNYLKVAGIEHCLVVTDAMAAAGLGPGRYRLSHWEVLVGEDRVARAPDGAHLIGSAGTMQRSWEILTGPGALSSQAATQLLSTNPRRAIGEK